MRGKVLREGLREHRLRITPAYAGKSEEIDRDAEIQRDHPRICGEKVRAVLRYAPFVGSPPHMRGKVRCKRQRRSQGGITPAYAGKRNFGCIFAALPWDHPRICGEKSIMFTTASFFLGSPPHMRGKGPMCGSDNITTRITPAYAGKRSKNILGLSPI